MRMTEAQIRRVIREEIKNTLSEAGNFVYYPDEQLESDEFADLYKPKQDPRLVKKSFFPDEGKENEEELATFKVQDLLKAFVVPKSDKDVELLKPLRDFILNFKDYMNKMNDFGVDKAKKLRNELYDMQAKVVKKGSGNNYKYWVVMPNNASEGFKEVIIGKDIELAAFERITGIKINKPIASRPFKPASFQAGVPAGLQGIKRLKEAIRRIILKELRKR